MALYLSEGHWFVSFYNDYGDAQTVGIKVSSAARDLGEGCPRGCSGKDHGQCVLGRCQCEPGFGGDDCSQGESGRKKAAGRAAC